MRASVEKKIAAGRPGVVKTPGLSPLGFVMALPPILLILFFVGFPIVLALGFTLGFTGGLNSVVSTIGLNIHHADHWWGTLAAYGEVFTDARFLNDLVVTLLADQFRRGAVHGVGNRFVPEDERRLAAHPALWAGRCAALHPRGHRILGYCHLLFG